MSTASQAIYELETFDTMFELLTENKPFPWQRELYRRFIAGRWPKQCDIPTGLGKTSVIAVWLIALIHHPGKVARRLVYVVNRRTVVDQTTDEVERLRTNLQKLEELPDHVRELAISTLRGQHADNREWSADPSRPAVICGTVDMIGSRLLFEGYGIGFKSRPLHAGFLGQDVLLVHDEAHLEPAFQKLIESIETEQHERERANSLPWPKLRIMALSATARSSKNKAAEADELFGLTDDERKPPAVIPTQATEPIHHVWRRLTAKKSLRFHSVSDERKLAEEVSKYALQHKDSGAAVLVFVRTVEDVNKVKARLADSKSGVPSANVLTLTGTMRGYERDQLVTDPTFKRYLQEPVADATQGTVYLICTSAGEVGVNISADHMVCDLSTFDSMAQRLGRVNRFGVRNNTCIDIVHPESFDEKKPNTQRAKTLALLKQLPGDASPKNLGELRLEERLAAFAPEPIVLPTTDILFDAWTLTSIRGKLPGRPPIEPYLHGIAEWQPPEAYVAWRREVEIVTGELLEFHTPTELLDNYPLKPHELLRDRSDRIFKEVETLAKRTPTSPAWLVDRNDEIEVTTVESLADKRRKDRINNCIILLPPSAGGLTGGILDGASVQADDVADIPPPSMNARVRLWSDDPLYETETNEMRRIRSIELHTSEDDGTAPALWEWFEKLPLEGGRTAKKPVEWKTHVGDVVERVKRMVAGLSLPKDIGVLLILAAKLHDHGKRRDRFQLTLGNRSFPKLLLAKSGRKGARLPEPFRHEFASMLDAQDDVEFQKLPHEAKDLVLHLIATHHGRGRPHFDPDEAFDPERALSDADALAVETPRRFAHLQRKYGRWGLAYLESLLRAADWAASEKPSAFVDEAEDRP